MQKLADGVYSLSELEQIFKRRQGAELNPNDLLRRAAES
jgi:hypothetical protein